MKSCRAARLTWLGWCALLGALYLFENNTGTRILLYAALICPPLSILPVLLRGRRAGLQIIAPESAAKNALCPVECRLIRPFSLAVYSVTLETRNLLTGEQTRTAGRARFQISSRHCGMLELRASLTVRDPFGLTQFSVPGSAVEYTLCRPILSPAELPQLFRDPAFDSLRWAADQPGQDPSEIHALRTYMPGDPVKQIHWKLSRKLDETMLRESSLPLSDQLVLAFDAFCPESDRAARLDSLAEAFLSLSQALAAAHVAHNACWQIAEDAYAETHAVETEEDFFALTTHFFRAPLAAAPLPLSGIPAFQSVILFAARFPAAEEVPLGLPLTVIAPGALPEDAIYRAIPLAQT